MIRARRLRDLTLASPPAPGRPCHLSAASGLAAAGGRLYVVADDELHLGSFDEAGDRPGNLVRLFAGELPDGRKARKARKPDLEVLTRLPPFAACPSGALLALGSGSRPSRRRGALLSLDASGSVSGAPLPLDLSGLHDHLARCIPRLNVEGGSVAGDELFLLQRGNKGDRLNALIRLPLSALLQGLGGGIFEPGDARISLVPVELGSIDGVPLSFTDCATLPDGRIVFTAAAEDTADSYHDGGCAGSAVGVLDPAGRVLRLEPLEARHKVEGVHAWIEGAAIGLLLVTDADDAAVPASLLAAELA